MKQSEREQALFIYFISLAAAAASFALPAFVPGLWPAPFGNFGFQVVVILATAVFVSAALFFSFVGAPKTARLICTACACAIVVCSAPMGALPMIAASAVAILTEFLSIPKLTVAVAAIWAVCAVGILFVQGAAGATGELLSQGAAGAGGTASLPPLFVMATITVSALIAALSVYVIRLLKKRESEILASNAKSDRIEELRETVRNQSRSTKTMGQISKLEERNRLAARIHDEVGHGMSGSILLLEGAIAIMESDPAGASETVRRAAEHLRESTDKIRAVLREERTESVGMSLAGIRRELAEFEVGHPNVRTSVTVNGDVDGVVGTVWTCIRDNMVEAMTNTLKHSSATRFDVTIANSRGLLRAEFADNGGGGGWRGAGGTGNGTDSKHGASSTSAIGSGDDPSWSATEPDHASADGGMGLHSMEERCALCYGRCFFRREADGFHVVMTFPLRDMR